MSSPPSSCWASVASALCRPRQRPPTTTREPSSLQEQLVVVSERARVERLRERADALRLELDAVAGEAEAAEAAARHAERRAAEADAGLRAAATGEALHEAEMRALDEEIVAKNQRLKVLQAIVATITPK